MLYVKRWAKVIGILTLVLASIIVLANLLIIAIGAEDFSDSEQDVENARFEAVERMRRGFEGYEKNIDISDLSVAPDELGRLFADATKDTPYLFYVSNNLAYTFRTGGCVVAIKPNYTMEMEEAELAVEYCKAEVKKMARMAEQYDGELERLTAVHDLICRRFAYDTTLESNNIYTFFKSGMGTCQSYTWTYMAILRELGIECRYVASDSIAHIWLAVKIDGEWYHSDVTWDDPPTSEGGGEQSRAHILFSDEKADADGYINRYSSSEVKCTDKKYDGDDLLSVIPYCSIIGDVDHDGAVLLEDILALRLYMANEIEAPDLCLFCSDADRNCVIDETDLDHIRKIILVSG